MKNFKFGLRNNEEEREKCNGKLLNLQHFEYVLLEIMHYAVFVMNQS